MNESSETETSTEEKVAPPLRDLLLASANCLRERVAVQALVGEEHLLTLNAVRAALVRETDHGVECAWEHMGGRLYRLGLDDRERAFLDLVLSMAGAHQTSLIRVQEVDDRQLVIVLRALIALSGRDAIAVGTRV
ncbi:hypothetical protein [Streptomyces flaveus]|uniref:Uncharacterized protein n=1 Tax=Streptomyces flaveus TaxID=66370 RepID=A0A917QQP3_9ACTN|nr:hypothetical protein [Streptomyces flaveus]GGK63651.1 hypothetical protein GCM10010094_25600 [Streptomyces flaveus]